MASASEGAIGIVAIGRNEGDRLEACLRSVLPLGAVVYVDSGSSDGSQAFARGLGILVVDLPTPPPFTAARARNAGSAAMPGDTRFIQFIDGDCEIVPGWIHAAHAAMIADPGLAAVFGRRRERHPERSIYNRMCDNEWNAPIGPARSTGGDALFRAAPLHAAGGYTESLIAGEEPDLCLRLRAAGWRIARIDQEMTLHDAAITRFPQWWRRTMRGGYAAAEHVAIHGDAADESFAGMLSRVRLWAVALPGLAAANFLIALLGWRWFAIGGLAVILVYPLQVVRLAVRDRRRWPDMATALKAGWFSVLGKFAELAGARRYARDRRRRTSSGLIEYKG